ncbi:MAG: Sodium/glucose cotransporter [Candidatus Scalindua rubra]|uniref:Sodium/glucose cotransporter n=1 Tax=Candidatus Scalindua rubra TaxID=1872076 RepID=A0A1E3X844_9BACT|nr:MAG: Sodium/glucose cotransporter [Candidatus Scalindua rubra]
MTLIDWIVLIIYLIGIVGLGVWLAKHQQSTDDYFLGGRKMGPTVIATSLAANQVSAISLISAPAFVALKTGGGIKWLQYEFAVPLAMIAIMFLLVPTFMINYLPVGVVGLVMAGLFAASMSSIDSAYNSLSAVTVSDFVLRFKPKVEQNPLKMLRLSRLITLLWGIFSAGGAYFVARSSSTVIEIVNMIGSAFSGPILATFLGGIIFRSLTGAGVIMGIIVGTALNFFLGQYIPSISWLWWGPIGFCTTLSVSLIYSKIAPTASRISEDWTLKGILEKHPEKQSWLKDKRVCTLVIYTFIIIIISITVSRVLHSIL